MRTMHLEEIAVFVFLASSAFFASVCILLLLFPSLAWTGEFRGIVTSFLLAILAYSLLLCAYRLLMWFCPLRDGDIAISSRQEFLYHIHLLFFLFFFYPVMKSNLLPVPLLRLFYLALGAKLGPNTYSGGILFDPFFIKIGRDSIVGQGAMLIPHVIEGRRLAHYPIQMGDGVTIGANAVILSDVEVGDHAIIAAGSVVPKGTRIPARELWGGMPAKRLGRVNSATTDSDQPHQLRG